jgi:DNA replication protein DnaC
VCRKRSSMTEVGADLLGATGVGKTHLAVALAETLLGLDWLPTS